MQTKRVCRYHGSVRGCYHGSNCRFSHNNPFNVPLCFQYEHSNSCRYGSNCKFRHSTSFDNSKKQTTKDEKITNDNKTGDNEHIKENQIHNTDISTQQNTNRQQYIELTKNCSTIMKAFCDEKMDITSALSTYKQMLTHYTNNTFYNEKCRGFIIKTFLEHSFIALMKRDHTNNHNEKDYNIADEITNCCKLLMAIAIPLIKRDSYLAVQIIYYCTNCNSKFFQNFGHDFRERRGQPLDLNEQKHLKEWRNNEIKPGTYIDCLQGNRWVFGIVNKIEYEQDDVEKTNKLLEIHNETDHIDINKLLPLTTDTIAHFAKPLTKSIENIPHMLQWRKELNIMDGKNKCDVFDAVGKWYTCTILENDPAQNRFKIHYDGWSHRYDEFIHRDDMKCQPYLTHATGGRETEPMQTFSWLADIEPCPEDEEDVDADDVFAVYRGRLGYQSFHLVDIINAFGRYGGFDALIQRFSNHEPSISWKHLRFIVSPLSKFFRIYSKKTAKRFIPKIVELTFEILESLSDEELRHDYFKRIVESIINFLQRFHKIKEIEIITEKFQLRMTINSICKSDWGIDMVYSIVKLIAEYATGCIINCSNMNCSEEVLVYNPYILPRKPSEYNYYRIANSNYIRKEVKNEEIHTINGRYWMIYCLDCSENNKCRFCKNNTLQTTGICLNHRSCTHCGMYVSRHSFKCKQCDGAYCNICIAVSGINTELCVACDSTL